MVLCELFCCADSLLTQRECRALYETAVRFKVVCSNAHISALLRDEMGQLSRTDHYLGSPHKQHSMLKQMLVPMPLIFDSETHKLS